MLSGMFAWVCAVASGIVSVLYVTFRKKPDSSAICAPVLLGTIAGVLIAMKTAEPFVAFVIVISIPAAFGLATGLILYLKIRLIRRRNLKEPEPT
jgi:hypothetical protein